MSDHTSGNIGLKNLGNTCFINSSLQILKQSFELNDVLKSKCKKDVNLVVDNIIFYEWLDIHKKLLQKGGDAVSPQKFLSGVHKVALIKRRDNFTQMSQNDMSEFFLFVLECLHNSISRPRKMQILGVENNEIDKKATLCYKTLQSFYEKEFSEIVDLFYAVSLTEITSIDTKSIFSIKSELFSILDLPLPHGKRNLTLHCCFKELFNDELLDGDNAWYNDKTDKYQSVIKKTYFWNVPKIFVMTLKRVSLCGKMKRNVFVDFPLINLDMSKYVSSYDKKDYVYQLFAVCNHYGSMNGGHYTCVVLNSKNEWISYDDENVQKIEKVRDIVTSSAYCLFYRRNNC